MPIKQVKGKLYLLVFLLLVSCTGIKQKNRPILLSDSGYDTIIDGRHVEIYTIRNSSGATAQLTNFGARWISMWVPDKNGNLTDVVLGFSTLKDYLTAGEPYHGAIVGRICGRIDKGLFTLDGTEYKLSNNDLFGTPVKNHLHGGIKGFHKQVWDAETFRNEKGEQGIRFSYTSADGEEGFPGNLKAQVSYLLTENNEMIIEYDASTDKPTIVNLTSHAYFNLNGEGNGNILDHMMKLNADRYIESDKELIPTGNILEVKDTPLDYREFRTMGFGINQNHSQIITGKGYAAAMVINNWKNGNNQEVAVAYSKESGIILRVFSDKPSLQLYNAWLFDGNDTGKSGKPYVFSGGFVMEPQGYPDAPNHPDFPEITLRPDQHYHHIDTYKFGVMK